MLNKVEQQTLLSIARETLNSHFKNKKYKFRDNLTENLQKKLGAFVTLKIQDELRGCIGYISAPDPLYKTISYLAEAAAFNDDRFDELDVEELPKITIEISVLSEPIKINSIDEIVLGQHGVIVEQDHKRGIFLPEVATENNWDIETLLNTLCEEKAEIPKEAWKNNKVTLYTFETENFYE